MALKRKTNALIALICSLSFLGFSQEETGSIYFPQEQIVHPDCDNLADKNSCFNNIIKNRVTEIVNVKVKKLKIKKDTLKINIVLSVDLDGTIKQNADLFRTRNRWLGKKATNSILASLNNLPKTKVLNRKPDFYSSKHIFNFEYAINQSKTALLFYPIDTKKKYDGGIIEEIPVFPGCEGLSDKESRTCFQTNMQKHIKKNFKYPDAAFKNGISGKVYLIMTIDKEGVVKNIRTKGPAPILEEEAHRIMSLLPKMKPGLENGKQVSVPYSIPITFSIKKPL